MASHKIDTSVAVDGIPTRSVPGAVKGAAGLGILIGLGAAGYGLATHKDLALASFVSNYMFWGGMAQGALMLAVAMTLVKARWGMPLKRYAEAFGLMFPVMYALLLVFLLVGGLDIYPWMHEQMPAHKAIYLQPGFFVARQAVGLGILATLSFVYIRSSLRADLGTAAERLGDKAPGWWSKFTSGWQGADKEQQALHERQFAIAPLIAIFYALTFTVMAVDMSMSLAPYWFANMFPAWYFASAFWSGLVGIAILSLTTRKWLGVESFLKPNVYHDLGKLTFGFTMFWGYTAFAQYLAIWYGNMTEEIGFILLRTEVAPWDGLFKVVVSLCFLMPFSTLLSRGIKKIPSAYLGITSLIAVGIFLERFWVVMPSVQKEADLVTPLIITVGMGCGFLGLFALGITSFLSKVPAIPVGSPMIQPDPDHVHVHPSAEHAH
ncbi:MAG: hypothetical protein H6742_11195 [Alphaproteobacteria bacterium]|nr:hypothetical protein [Alphaproteobacteria bacterium]